MYMLQLRKKMSKIYYLYFHLKTLEKDQIKSKVAGRKNKDKRRICITENEQWRKTNEIKARSL